MRKKLVTVGLAAVLSMGFSSAALAESAGGVTAQEESNGDDNGDAGLWGLVGLIGLAGLAGLRRDDRDVRRDDLDRRDL